MLVHGAVADHGRWRAAALPGAARHRPCPGPAGPRGQRRRPGYDLAREFEDVAAVVDAVAEASGSAVDVYGHSFGGLCAFGGATLTANIGRLVLYEGWPPTDPAAREAPPGGERLDALLAGGPRRGRRDDVREVVRMQAELAALQAQPAWPARVAPRHDRPRAPGHPPGGLRPRRRPDHRADPAADRLGQPRPVRRRRRGRGRRPARRRVVVLEGQQHVADILDPERFMPLVPFLRER